MSAQSVPCCNTNECAIYCLMQVHNLLLDATQSVVCDVHEHTICCFLPHKFAICNTNFPIFPRLWPKMPFSLKTFLTCRNAPQLSQSFPTFLKMAKNMVFIVLVPTFPLGLPKALVFRSTFSLLASAFLGVVGWLSSSSSSYTVDTGLGAASGAFFLGGGALAGSSPRAFSSSGMTWSLEAGWRRQSCCLS